MDYSTTPATEEQLRKLYEVCREVRSDEPNRKVWYFRHGDRPLCLVFNGDMDQEEPRDELAVAFQVYETGDFLYSACLKGNLTRLIVPKGMCMIGFMILILEGRG